MPTIKQTILAQGKHFKNFTTGRGGKKVKYIIVHYTSTLAPALSNIKYFASRYVGASAHYFIDRNGDLYQSVKESDTAWSVGARNYKHPNARNTNSVNIEMVAKKNEFTPQQKATLRKLVNYLMAKYDVPKSNVFRHYDVTGKKCPAWYITPEAYWILLKNFIANYVKPAPKPMSKPTPTPKPTPKAKPKTKPKTITPYTLTRVLKKRNTGKDVVALQKGLQHLGYSHVAVDGKFGSKTEAAVKDLQKKKRLTPDGIVGKSTAQVLGWLWNPKK